MKFIATTTLLFAVWMGSAQTTVTESVLVTNQEELILDFDFADDIVIKTWDKQEVLVEVKVTINNGDDDDIFKLITKKSDDFIQVIMDKKPWRNRSFVSEGGTTSELHYIVYLPESMSIDATTINGNFEVTNMDQELRLKTVSGDIDLTVGDKKGVDFSAKTVTGEVYSDLTIDYSDGKSGLNQHVGMDVKGRINSGGRQVKLETVSGSVYLRKG